MGHFSVSVKLFKEALPVLSIVSDQSLLNSKYCWHRSVVKIMTSYGEGVGLFSHFPSLLCLMLE